MERAQRLTYVQLLHMTDLEGKAQAGRLVDSRLNHLLKNKAGVVRFLNEQALEQLSAERGLSPTLGRLPGGSSSPGTGSKRPSSPAADQPGTSSDQPGPSSIPLLGEAGPSSLVPASTPSSVPDGSLDALQSLRDQHELLSQMVDWSSRKAALQDKVSYNSMFWNGCGWGLIDNI